MKYLNQLMNEREMTRSDLSRMSGVPESTLRGILNGKANLYDCKAGTLLSLAFVLHTTVESLLEHYYDEYLRKPTPEQVPADSQVPLSSFYELVDATVCVIRNDGDYECVRFIYHEGMIEGLFEHGCYREALFLLGVTDYLIHKHHMETDNRFDAFRYVCLEHPVYHWRAIREDEETCRIAKAFSREYAIPELAQFNIFMTKDDIDPVV